MGRGFERGVAAGIAVLTAAMVVVAALCYLDAGEFRDKAGRSARSREVLAALAAVRFDTVKLQADLRVYLVTGFPEWIPPYRASAAKLRASAARLAELTADQPGLRLGPTEAGREIEEGIAGFDGVLQLRRDHGHAAVVEFSRRRGPKSFVDPLLETLAAAEAAERKRLGDREVEAGAAYNDALFYGIAAAALGLAAVGLLVGVLAVGGRARLAAAVRLAEQRELLSATLSSIGDAVIATDAEGNVTFLNPVAEALTGWPQSEAAGVPLERVFRIVNESTREPVENPAFRALREGTVVGLANHTVLISRDGTERPIDDSAAPIRAAGAVSGAVLVFRDITEKKRIETALRVREERYRVLATATSDVVYSMSADWSEMLPLDGRELVASNAEPIRGWMEKNLPRSEHALVRGAIARAVAGKSVFELEHRVNRPDGMIGWTLSRAAPILDAAGNVAEWFGTSRDVTDRKRAGEEAARLAEALGLAVAAADLGTWEWDPVTDLMTLSVRAGEIYGVDATVPHRREVLRDLLHTDDRDRARTEAQKAVAERKDYDTEYRLVRPDGGTRWVAARGRGVYDAAGTLVRMNGVAQDITARKRAEDELRDIRARMEAALAAGAIGTWSWDVPADRFFGDASLARIFGVKPEVVAGGPIAGLMGSIHPDDRERVGGLVAKAVEEGGGYEADYRVRQPDGSWRWVAARGRVELDAGGRATRFPGVVVDVTERKRAEDELARVTAESERRRRLYEAVLSSTPDLAYVWGLDHRFAYANEGLLRMWGKTWDEAIGLNCLELGYEPWHAAMHDREIDQVVATRQPIRGEVPFTGSYGRRVYDYLLVPVLGTDGEVEAVAGTTRDVTDRKRMEDDLREADRKKDDFIALLAHELRNPLAPIRNGLEAVRLSDDRATRERARVMMDRQLSHMVRLIDDLLDVSRIGRHKMELRRAAVALADVVASAVDTARPAVEEAGHELRVALPPEPVHLDADLTRLSQVFSNLLTNSAKYTGRGGRIWLSAEPREAAVAVTVRDTGIGIPADALPNIFDMFSQVDRSVERNTGGLGIGLALVKGLVEMHGGTVLARSDGEGRGAEFTVTLPVLSRPPAAARSSAEPATAPSRSRRRVLVVDDSRDGADSLAMMLGLRGDEVRTAHDGLQAVERAESFRPEVILMDVGMPKLNGLDATRRIRDQPWGRGVTIIALTGWGQESDRQRSREAGCDGHLVKPVSLPDLDAMLTGLAAVKPD